MKTYLAVIALTVLAIGSSRAQIISQWNFDSLTLSSTAGATPVVTGGSLAPDIGTGLASATHSSTATVYSTPSGNDSAKAFSSNHWAIGDYYQFQTATTSFSNIHIGFFHNSSSTGPGAFKLQYSTDGTTFTDVTGGAYTIPASVSWTPTTYSASTVFYFDLSSISAINDLSAVYFRLTDTSTTSVGGGTVATTGTSRVDQFTVSQGSVDIAPVPEPGTVAMVALGLGVAIFSIRRRRTMA